MIKKTLAATVATAALALAPVAVGASPAQAAEASSDVVAKKGCVTKKEYKKVKTGMAKAKVHKIFGTAGKREFKRGGGEGRSYQACTSKKGRIGIVYGGNKVAGKAAQW
jgi:hypothetical protein